VATGDGLAIAYRAGAELMDLEFMQFHPTALALEGVPSFLISEAVRGEGGILRDACGKTFMVDYHPDRELAPRDVVARAIHQQMIRTSSSHVWLDITHLPREKVERRFPSIVGYCRRYGIDPVHDPIPVAPAAHYLMGGIRTDSWARTSIPGLLACGEVACTGVHGANRLASNSLLEGLVFARRAVATILRGDAKMGIAPAPGRELSLETVPACTVESDACAARSRQELADVMWRLCSLVRSAESLQEARELVAPHPPTPEPADPEGTQGPAYRSRQERGRDVRLYSPLPRAGEGSGVGGRSQYELANMALLSALLVESALLRRESRGAHYRSDFAQSDPAWQGRIVVSQQGARLSPLGLSERPAAA
jgi:L-aspartate oxidase